MPYALLIFIAMPIIEIAVLLRVGSSLGWLLTLAIVILTAILGTALLRQQGLATLNRARQRLGAGEMPAEQLLEGMVLLVGGVLLLTPGFVTDAFGFACLVPISRRWLARWIATRSTLIGFGGISMTPGATRNSSASTPVGSGSTEGAQRPGAPEDAFGADLGGRPKPISGRSAPNSDIIDAEFRSVDD